MAFGIRWIVLAFSVILVVAGALPLLQPGVASATSGAPAYAWFHIVAGVVGLALVWGGGRLPAWFALVFGLVDLYQGAASALGWFPLAWFGWTPVDDLLHWTLGAALVLLGVLTLGQRRAK